MPWHTSSWSLWVFKKPRCTSNFKSCQKQCQSQRMSRRRCFLRRSLSLSPLCLSKVPLQNIKEDILNQLNIFQVHYKLAKINRLQVSNRMSFQVSAGHTFTRMVPYASSNRLSPRIQRNNNQPKSHWYGKFEWTANTIRSRLNLKLPWVYIITSAATYIFSRSLSLTKKDQNHWHWPVLASLTQKFLSRFNWKSYLACCLCQGTFSLASLRRQ